MKMNKRDNVKPMSNGTKLLKATVEMNLLKALSDDLLCVYHIGDGGSIEMYSNGLTFKDDVTLILMLAEAFRAATIKLKMSDDELRNAVSGLLPLVKDGYTKKHFDDDEDDEEDDEEDDDE